MTDRPSRHLRLVPPLPEQPGDRPTFTHGRDQMAILLRLRHPSRQNDEPKQYTCFLGSAGDFTPGDRRVTPQPVLIDCAGQSPKWVTFAGGCQWYR